MRRVFFGEDGSVEWNTRRLQRRLRNFRHLPVDVRDRDAIDKLFGDLSGTIAVVIHAAAQPSHDWAAREPFTDFSINATGTLVMLEATRQHAPEATFIFTSTNKVYGDTPNALPLVELDTRWEVEP
jgi:CDP-paratose 2-epimerase